MSIDIVEAFTAKNKCYQAGVPLTPQGLMLHSIGTPQPSAAVLARYFDQYQPGGQSVCVHAFVQADGTVYQTLPWEMRGWHCGGTANSTHIGIEMTEPSAGVAYAEAAEQITGTYHAAVELFAQLCEMYSLDPLADGVIIGHAEGHRRGVASNHADPTYLWDTYGMGFTMDGFRTAVAEAMARARALSASKVNIRGSSRPMVSSMLTRKRDRRSLDKNAGLRIGFPSFPQRLPQSGYAPCGVT